MPLSVDDVETICMVSDLQDVKVDLGVTQAIRVREHASNGRANMRIVQSAYSLLMCTSSIRVWGSSAPRSGAGSRFGIWRSSTRSRCGVGFSEPSTYSRQRTCSSSHNSEILVTKETRDDCGRVRVQCSFKRCQLLASKPTSKLHDTQSG